MTYVFSRKPPEILFFNIPFAMMSKDMSSRSNHGETLPSGRLAGLSPNIWPEGSTQSGGGKPRQYRNATRPRNQIIAGEHSVFQNAPPDAPPVLFSICPVILSCCLFIHHKVFAEFLYNNAFCHSIFHFVEYERLNALLAAFLATLLAALLTALID